MKGSGRPGHTSLDREYTRRIFFDILGALGVLTREAGLNRDLSEIDPEGIVVAPATL